MVIPAFEVKQACETALDPITTQTKAIKEGFFKTYTNQRLTLTLAVKSQIAKV